MPLSTYTTDELDKIHADMYTQEEVDAFIKGLQTQIDGIPKPPLPVPGKIIGVSNLTAFRGLKISGNRIFNGFTAVRGYNPASVLAQVTADLNTGRRSYLSIDSPTKKGDPNSALDWPLSLAGQPIASFVPSVQTVHDNGGILIIHHEPENDPGKPENFRNWFGLMSDYYKSQVPGVRVGLCLMSWTGRNGVSGFAPWTPDVSKFDVFCVDNYAEAAGVNADTLFGNSLAYARQLKKPMMITETGQHPAYSQSSFIATLDAFVRNAADVEGFLYWNAADYTLNVDGLAYFSSLVNSGKYVQAKTAV